MIPVTTQVTFPNSIPGTLGGNGNTLNFAGGSSIIDNGSGKLTISSLAGACIVLPIASQHVLLGGLTTDGTGILQFPSSSSNAGGIAFGTDTYLYRANAGEVLVQGTGNATYSINAATGSNPYINFLINGSRYAQLQADVSGNFYVRVNSSTLALTIATNAVATFANQLVLWANTSVRAALKMPAGTTPSFPIDGEMWYDGTNLKFRQSSTTKTITWS